MYLVLFLSLYFHILSQASPLLPLETGPQPVRVPLHTRQVVNDAGTLRNVLDAAKTRYKARNSVASAVGLKKRQATGDDIRLPTQMGSIKLSGSDEDVPYGRVTTGPHSPLQDLPQTEFSVLFDTGSGDFLLPGPDCKGCVPGKAYNRTGSDMNYTSSIPFGASATFDIIGRNYLDDVTVGGITSYNTIVTAMTEGRNVFGPGYVGVLGLGFSSLSLNKQSSFFENLLVNQKVPNPEFAFFLGREGETESEFTLGGRDKTRFKGPITTMPVTEKKWWKIAIDGFSVNQGITDLTYPGQAIIDTGTPVIFGPKRDVDALYKAMDPTAFIDKEWSDDQIAVYNYRCKAQIDVALVFGGRTCGMNKRDFQWMRVEGKPERCRGSIMGMDLGTDLPNHWVIGEPFLRNWYSIFSYVLDSRLSNPQNEGSATVSFVEAIGNQEQPDPSEEKPKGDGSGGPVILTPEEQAESKREDKEEAERKRKKKEEDDKKKKKKNEGQQPGRRKDGRPNIIQNNFGP